MRKVSPIDLSFKFTTLITFLDVTTMKSAQCFLRQSATDFSLSYACDSMLFQDYSSLAIAKLLDSHGDGAKVIKVLWV